MTDLEATYEDFIASQRSGRRNAIHELPAGGQEPAGLSQELAQLDINKPGEEGEGAEKDQKSPSKEESSQSESN